MKKLLAGILGLALFALPAPTLHGQVALGPQVSMAEDVDLGVGVAFTAPMAPIHEALEFAADFTLYFPDADGLDYFEADATLRYFFAPQSGSVFLPFAMGGLTLGRSSWDGDVFPGGKDGSESKLALRLGGGFKIPMDRFTPFAELALGVGDLPDYTLRGGLTFPIGG